MSKNKVIYTALFGDYDELQEPKEKWEEWDFICFTDNKDLKSNIWSLVYVNPELTNNLENRKYKILPHKFLSQYDISLYIDANIKILKNPIELVEKYLKINNIAMPDHFKNNCIYKEAKDILFKKKANPELINQQMNFYKSQGFPPQFGLKENNVILRKHNEKEIMKLMECWWEQLNNFTHRDQLSFMYCVWKHNIKISKMEESARGSAYFKIYPHKNKMKKGLLGKIINPVYIYYLNNLKFFSRIKVLK